MSKDNQSFTRYQRQITLPEIGQDGQTKLSQAKILCIGAGGLGCPALQYLAAAGIGTLGIVDGDTVELNNLQRQILYKESQIGENKAQAAAQSLAAINSDITITPYPQHLDAKLCAEIFPAYDVIIDAADNFATTFLINDGAVKYSKPFVSASILGLKAQVSTYNADEGAPCYRCLFPEAPKQQVQTCAQAGILGAVTGIIGSIQALDAIKIILQRQELSPLRGQLWSLDLATLENKLTLLSKDPKCLICSLPKEEIDMTVHRLPSNADEITIAQTMQQMKDKPSTILIDVREQHEWEAGHMPDADHLPLSFLLEGHRPDTLPKDAEIILYCKAGMRSMQALQILKSQGYASLKSMSGGFDAWVQSFKENAA